MAIIIIALIFIIPVKNPQAQSIPTLAILEIDLRPEFDQPGVLVVYHLVLSSDVRLPATMTIHIPERAGNPSQVDWVDPTDGSMTTMPYKVDLNNDSNSFTFTTSAYEVNFEYHDPALTIDGNKHAFQYDWNGDFPITNLSIYIQQPVGATDMAITPSLGSPKQGDNNITYYYARLGEVKVDTTFSIQLSYTKEDSYLSVEQLQVKPSVNLSEDTPGRTSLREILPWLIGVIIVLLLMGALWWIWLAKNSPVPLQNIKITHGSRHKKENLSDSDSVNCPQCGHRAELDDVFCRVCGSKLKS